MENPDHKVLIRKANTTMPAYFSYLTPNGIREKLATKEGNAELREMFRDLSEEAAFWAKLP